MKFVRIVDVKAVITAIFIPLAVGGLSAWLSGDFSDEYAMLVKPPLSPNGYVFPIVWTVLYILMGISSYLIWEHYRQTGDGRTAIIIYAVQLALNFLWSIVFFRLDMLFAALIILVLLDIAVLAMILAFGKLVPAAAALQIPYLLWCLFATYLNFGFLKLN